MTVSFGSRGPNAAPAGAVQSSSAAAPTNATMPPVMTSRHDRGGIGGSGRDDPAADPSTASVVIRTAWPSSRLIMTARASAATVSTGALHPNPALALRHQNVR